MKLKSNIIVYIKKDKIKKFKILVHLLTMEREIRQKQNDTNEKGGKIDEMM
jgi:hypothetical protein